VIIEWLVFQVEPEWHDRYLEADMAIWTTFLQSYPGFFGKQVWQNPDRPNEITFVIQWQTRENWESIPPEALAEIDRQFVEKLGRSFELIESKEYGVRRAD
jgi:uncharacterized protein (TIGR03792 family)